MSARRYEKRKVREHRGRHVGGPGKPDYTRGSVQGEVKNWARPMSKYDVKKEAQKGRKEISCKAGYTEGAIKYAQRYRPSLKLFQRKKRIR